MQTSAIRLIALVALFIVATDNYRFFSEVTKDFPPTRGNLGFLGSLFIVFVCVLIILFNLVRSRWTLKPTLMAFLLLASVISYFANSFHIIVDDTMIQNVAETNSAESLDLFSIRLILYVVFLGLLPALFVYRARIEYRGFRREQISRLFMLSGALVVMVLVMLPFGKHYSSFFREHKPLRFDTNPTYALYSAGKYLTASAFAGELPLQQIGLDAHQVKESSDRRLVVMVVGEAARADHFAFNGYPRATNPRLAAENIFNFSEMYSCGTSTAVSVPCMFSPFERSAYSDKKAKATENVLDVLTHAGVQVLWRDNNSSSKGVADRLPYENFRDPGSNPVCNGGECRDSGMLSGLQGYIDSKEGDIVIVLHQMGNHGPAYYKRYPTAFARFAPVCRDNELETCRDEEIVNAYDNAILYTDYFLAQIIQLLKNNDERFKTALVYMSDHGESLGEGGLYLHGMPYLIAPDEQKHVAALMWFGSRMRQEIDGNALSHIVDNRFSQDNLFHTLLGLMNVRSSVYVENKDILAEVRS